MSRSHQHSLEQLSVCPFMSYHTGVFQFNFDRRVVTQSRVLRTHGEGRDADSGRRLELILLKAPSLFACLSEPRAARNDRPYSGMDHMPPPNRRATVRDCRAV